MNVWRQIPNALTLLRFALVPVLVILIRDRQFEAAFAVFACSALSDFADGWLARRWNARSRFGAAADPLADKLTMLATTLMLAAQSLLPLWLAAAIALRDTVIVVGAVAFHFAIGRYELSPTWLSKANTALLFLVLAAVLADAAGILRLGVVASALFALLGLSLAASGLHYVWIWGRKAVRGATAGSR